MGGTRGCSCGRRERSRTCKGCTGARRHDPQRTDRGAGCPAYRAPRTGAARPSGPFAPCRRSHPSSRGRRAHCADPRAGQHCSPRDRETRVASSPDSFRLLPTSPAVRSFSRHLSAHCTVRNLPRPSEAEASRQRSALRRELRRHRAHVGCHDAVRTSLRAIAVLSFARQRRDASGFSVSPFAWDCPV